MFFLDRLDLITTGRKIVLHSLAKSILDFLAWFYERRCPFASDALIDPVTFDKRSQPNLIKHQHRGFANENCFVALAIFAALI
jgi:hypothetical protein